MSGQRNLPDRFESEAAERLGARAKADPDEVQALIDLARNLPRRRVWGTRLALLAAIVPMAVVASVAFGLYWQAGNPPAPTSSELAALTTPASSPSASATAINPSPLSSPSASLPDPAIWSKDARLSSCGGFSDSGTRVLTIVELAHESDYPQRLPSLGYSAELSRPDAALVVVYDGASPTDLQIDAGSGRTHAPSPGTYDICVATLGLHQRFTNLEIDWAYLTG